MISRNLGCHRSIPSCLISCQSKCEVISSRQVKGSYSEGEVVDKETGRLKERTVTTVIDFFTGKLPEGTTPPTVEIQGKAANA
jgi:hypothetical protein